MNSSLSAAHKTFKIKGSRKASEEAGGITIRTEDSVPTVRQYSAVPKVRRENSYIF